MERRLRLLTSVPTLRQFAGFPLSSAARSWTRPTMSSRRIPGCLHQDRLGALDTFTLYNSLNPLECRSNYSATSNNMKLVHWPLMGGLLHLQQEGDWAAQAPPRCTKCNSPPSTASVPITVLLYNGPLLCGFNVPIKG